MKSILIIVLVILMSITLHSQESIADLLPTPFDLPGLQIAGESEIYEGEDLFDMINGGAEIYLEFGFVKVISQRYSGITGNENLRIEIYQMTDPGAAFGIFSFTASGQKIIDRISYYLVSDDGYGMMTKGSYFIIVSYANLPESMKSNIMSSIADGLNNNIKELSELPNLLVSAQPPCHDAKQTQYFRGPMVLKNLSYLDFKIPFKFSEGVFYRCTIFDYMLFVPSTEKSKKELLQETISNILKKNPDFTVSNDGSGFSVNQNNQLKYEVVPNNNSVAIIKYF